MNVTLRLTIKASKSAPSRDFAEIIIMPDAPALHHSLSVTLVARCLHEVLFWMTRNRIRLHPKSQCKVARRFLCLQGADSHRRYCWVQGAVTRLSPSANVTWASLCRLQALRAKDFGSALELVELRDRVGRGCW